MATSRRSAAECIAYHVNYDFGEMSEYRYQSTRWSLPAIYALPSGYYAAPSNPQQVAKLNKSYAGLAWQHVGDAYGRPIYCAAA